MAYLSDIMNENKLPLIKNDFLLFILKNAMLHTGIEAWHGVECVRVFRSYFTGCTPFICNIHLYKTCQYILVLN